MRTTSAQRMRISRLKRLERTDRQRERIDRQSNSVVAWNLPPSAVLKDWHIDETGALARAVGRQQ